MTTTALLRDETDNFDLILQRIYYSHNCQYFYLALVISSIVIIITTSLTKFSIDSSPVFVGLETLVNLIILLDLLFKIKLQGLRKYLTSSYWNVFDAIVVLACLVLFVLVLLSHTRKAKVAEEISGEALLTLWSIT